MAKMTKKTKTTKAKSKKESAEVIREKLLEKVYAAREDAVELAGSMGLSLSALAEMLREPDVSEALGGLRLLADLQAQLIVSRYRTIAAAKLVELASCGEGNEVTRKACVDLLKVEVDGGIPNTTQDTQKGQPGIEALDGQRVLKVLSELGAVGMATPPNNA